MEKIKKSIFITLLMILDIFVVKLCDRIIGGLNSNAFWIIFIAAFFILVLVYLWIVD